MHPELWGPGLWHILFACAWNAPDSGQGRPLALLHELLDLTALLLPCEACRRNHVAHMATLKRRFSRPVNCCMFFQYLFHLKDLVNRTLTGETMRRRLSCRSPPLERLTERFALRGDVVDESLVADTLLLVAMDAAERGLHKEYRRFCVIAGDLLPGAEGSPLRSSLKATSQGILASARRTYHRVRAHHGLPVVDIERFQRMLQTDS